VSFCPSGALSERSSFDSIKKAFRDGKVVVAQVAPSLRVSIGEEFGKAPGTITTGQLVMALKRAGFHYVFDTNVGADLTIVEEGTEFAERLVKPKPGPFPMFTSCCPGWINLLEKEYPKLISRVSTCKSPQSMISALIKNWWAKQIGQKPENIFVVSLMPCTAKKDEILRPEISSSQNYQDTDYVMTTRECAKFLKEAGITDFTFSVPFDEPFCKATGAGSIFGTTGGVMEAILRYAGDKSVQTGNTGTDSIVNQRMKACRGMQGVKTSEVIINGTSYRVGVVHGIANAKRVLNELMKVGSSAFNYHLIEIMACPGGCIGGGGQPHSQLPNILAQDPELCIQLTKNAMNAPRKTINFLVSCIEIFSKNQKVL